MCRTPSQARPARHTGRGDIFSPPFGVWWGFPPDPPQIQVNGLNFDFNLSRNCVGSNAPLLVTPGTPRPREVVYAQPRGPPNSHCPYHVPLYPHPPTAKPRPRVPKVRLSRLKCLRHQTPCSLSHNCFCGRSPGRTTQCCSCSGCCRWSHGWSLFWCSDR